MSVTNVSSQTTPGNSLNIDEDLHDVKDDIFMEENVLTHGGTGNVSIAPMVDTKLVNEAFWPSLRKYRRVVCLSLVCYFGALFDGYAATASGVVTTNYNFIARYGMSYNGVVQLDAQWVAIWGAMLSVGQFIGMITGSTTADLFGRKCNMYLVLISLAISIVLSLVMTHEGYYAASRLFCGYGTGLVQSGLGVYVAEIAPTSVRSFLLFVYVIWYTVGGLLGTIIGQVVQSLHAPYKHLFYSEIPFMGVWALGLFFLPESPWYFARRGRTDAGKTALGRIYKGVPDVDLEHEWLVIETAIKQEVELREIGRNLGWKGLFTDRDNRRRLFIAFTPATAAHMVGLAFMASVPYYLTLVGVSNPLIPAIALYSTMLASYLVTSMVVERVGRRILLLTGIASMGCLCIGVAGIGTAAAAKGFNSEWVGPLVALGVCWTASYAFSIGGIVPAYLSDTASPVLRSKTAAVATAATALIGLVSNYAVPLLINEQGVGLGLRVGYLYGGLAIIAWLWNFFVVPETKGFTYRELNILFENQTSARQFPEAGRALRETHQATPA